MKSLFISVFILLYHGVFAGGSDEVSVSVMEGDPVTLNTNVTTNQQEEISWYFNGIRIALINGVLSKICTDVQCNEGTERFRDRLKLDHVTGSLTLTNTKTTDTGLYHLLIISSNSGREKIFNVIVHGVSAADRDKVKRKPIKERESVTLDPDDPSIDNAVPDSGLSSAAVAGIVGVVVLLLVATAAVAVAVIYYRKHQERRKNKMQHNHEQNGSSSNSNEPLMQMTTNETSPNPAKETSA